MAKEYKYKGYTFFSEEDYNEAKKENETIEYIKAKTDLGHTETVISLYNKLIDRNLVSTVIGLDFLKRLRAIALKDDMTKESQLRELPEITINKRKTSGEKVKLTRVQKLQRENLGLKIIIIGLVVIIIGMFVIVLTGKSSPLKSVYEQEIINRYAGWKQELDEQQQWINNQLYFLEQNGVFYNETEQ